MVNIHERDGNLGLRHYNRIAIVGVGGVGSNLALQLVLSEATDELDIYDADTVSESNLSRTPYRMRDIGRMKVYALKDVLDGFGRDVDVNAFPEKVFGQLGDGYDVIIDCRDYVDEFTKFSNIIVGYDGVSMTVHTNPSTERVFSVDNEHHGYTTQSYIVPPTIGAGIITQYLMNGAFSKKEVITTINLKEWVETMTHTEHEYNTPRPVKHQVKGRDVTFNGMWFVVGTDKRFNTFKELVSWIDTHSS